MNKNKLGENISPKDIKMIFDKVCENTMDQNQLCSHYSVASSNTLCLTSDNNGAFYDDKRSTITTYGCTLKKLV